MKFLIKSVLTFVIVIQNINCIANAIEPKSDYLKHEAFKNQFLLNALLNAEPKDYNIAPVVDNIDWMRSIYKFLQQNQNLDNITVTVDNPISHFDRLDAKEILSPLLKKYFNYELSDKAIKKFFKEECNLYKDDHKKTQIKYFLQAHVKKEVYETAQRAYQAGKNNIIMIIGQTPAYIGVMIDEIRKINNDNITKIVFVPFSGRPDYIAKLQGKGNIELSYLNLLNNDKEMIFRKVITERGFSPKNIIGPDKKLFVLDNSSGASFSSLLTLIYRWVYEENHNIPNITILHPSKQQDLSIQNEKGKWVPSKKLNLKMSSDLIFDIPVTFLNMNDNILREFDKIYDNLRIVPSFNSLYWRENYKKLFEQYPKEDAIKIIQAYKDYVKNNEEKK